MACPHEILHELQFHDVLGCKGCRWPSPQHSILVVPQYRKFDDINLALVVDRFEPEGFGIDEFGKDHLSIPTDTLVHSQETILWDVNQTLPPLGQKIWLRNVIEGWNFPGDFDFLFGGSSMWLLVQPEIRNLQGLHFLELFAGGYGGWKQAFKHMSQQLKLPVQSVGIEVDPNNAVTYAITHSATLFSMRNDIPRDLFLRAIDDWIIHGNVLDERILPPLAQWGVHCMTISSPCQPWSGSTKTPSVERMDGLLLLQSFLLARWLRPPIILAEQVVGFKQHVHKPWIMKALVWIGYKLVWQFTLDVCEQIPTSRPRWLAMFVRVHASLPKHPFMPWPKESNISHDFVIQWPSMIRKHLLLSENVVRIASDPTFLRRFGDKLVGNPLEKRIFRQGQTFPTFMAMYGSQHLLSPDLLKQFGYHGHFIEDLSARHQCRFLHPAEIWLLHGCLVNAFVRSDLTTAWNTIGNCITVHHAVLAVMNACEKLGFSASPFVIFQSLRQDLMRASRIQWKHCEAALLLHPIGKPPADIFMNNVQQLMDETKEKFNMSNIWSPHVGIVQSFDSFLKDVDPPASLVSQEEESPVEATAKFDPVVKGKLIFQHFEIPFWFASSIEKELLEQIWGPHMCCSFLGNAEDGQMASICNPCIYLSNHQDELMLETPENKLCFPGICKAKDNAAIVLILEGCHTVIRCAVQSNLNELPIFMNDEGPWFDQFGSVDLTKPPKAGMILVKEPISREIPPADPTFLMAAFRNVQIRCFVDNRKGTINILIGGDLTSRVIVSEFWHKTISEGSCSQLGKRAFVRTSHDQHVVCFECTPPKSTTPPEHFLMTLAIQAFQSMCDDYSNHFAETDHQVKVVLKLDGSIIWVGKLSKDTTIGILTSMLQVGLLPIADGIPFRLINKGKNLASDTQLESLPETQHRQAILLHAVPELIGGGPAKQQQRSIQQSAIASTFLDHGYDLPWVSKTVETLINKFGLPKIQSITSQPMGSAKLKALIALCDEASIALPKASAPTSVSKNAAAPWNNQKKRRGDITIDPSDFTLVKGFFLNQDSTPCEQLSSLRAQCNGVIIVSPEQAAPWIQEGQKLSADELGMIVLGKMGISKNFDVHDVTFPCTNPDGQRVLLTGQMFQLGAKDVTFQKGDPKQVAHEDAQLVAITLFKQDWSSDDWNDVLHSTMPFIRSQLKQDGLEIPLSMWGKSMRNGKATASPLQATSLQVHATFTSSKIDKLLQRSGFNKMFLTPKQPDGRLCSSYKIIWIEGDLCKVSALSAQCSACLGLVRGKTSLGLRFKDADFATAWSVLHPSLPLPAKSSGDQIYKIEGLPFGCTADMIQKWAKATTWDCVPFRAMGPQSWLVRTDVLPPEGVPMFNTHPVLIRHLPPRQTQQPPLLLGPRPKVSDKAEHGQNLAVDPWASWKGPRLTPSAASAPSRSIDGPVEAKFKAQAEQISMLQDDLKKINAMHEKQSQRVEKKFEQIEAQQNQHMDQVKQCFNDLTTRFEDSIAKSLRHSTKAMDDRFGELKALFQNSNKRPASPDHPMD